MTMEEKGAADAVRAQELSLWKEWKKGQSPQVLGQLIDSVSPVIHSTVNKFSTVPLPKSAIEAEAKKQAIRAFETYNPRMGASLGTHLHNYMRKVNRFVYEHQNIGRIPEHRITQIGTYQAVKGELRDRLGRDASAAELADELGWSLAEVERIERELRREIPESAVLDSDFSFLVADEASKLLGFIYYELTPQEKVVFEYLTGWAGKPKLTEDEIAARIGVTHARVKKIKAEIAAKIRRRM